jgi:hypothetical protein
VSAMTWASLASIPTQTRWYVLNRLPSPRVPA